MIEEKEYIKVDDLFRKGIVDDDDRGKATAWARMEQLLDREMPGKKRLLPYGGKLALPVSALLLVSATLLILKTNNLLPIPENKEVAYTANSGKITSNTSQTVNPNRYSAENIQKENVQNNRKGAHNPLTAQHTPSKGKDAAALTGHASVSPTGKSIGGHSYSSATALSHTSAIHPENTKSKTHRRNADRALASAQIQGHPGATLTKKDNAGNSTPASLSKTGSRQAIPPTVALPGQKGANPSPEEITINGNRFLKKEHQWFSVIQDSILRHTVHQIFKRDKNNRLVLFKTDTASQLVERIQYEPVTAWQKQQIEEQMNPQHAIAYASLVKMTNKHINSEALDNYKIKTVASKSDKKGLAKTLQQINDELNRLSEGETKYYFGATAGLNYQASRYSRPGWQAGLNVGYKVAERWGILGQFLWFHGSIGNFSLSETLRNYSNVTESPLGNGQTSFSGIENTVNNNYTVSAYNALMLPLQISYSLNEKLTVNAGPVFSYLMPAKMQTATAMVSQQVSSTGYVNPYENGVSQYSHNDFNARLGIGYLIGVSYDLNRKLSLNANVGQTLWTSKPGGSSSDIWASELLKRPSLQIGIGWYIGRTEKIAYIMDK